MEHPKIEKGQALQKTEKEQEEDEKFLEEVKIFKEQNPFIGKLVFERQPYIPESRLRSSVVWSKAIGYDVEVIEPHPTSRGEYGQILLTDKEYSKLEAQFGCEGIKKRIEILDLEILGKPEKFAMYQHHLGLILSWEHRGIFKDRLKETNTPKEGVKQAVLPTIDNSLECLVQLKEYAQKLQAFGPMHSYIRKVCKDIEELYQLPTHVEIIEVRRSSSSLDGSVILKQNIPTHDLEKLNTYLKNSWELLCVKYKKT